MYFDFISYNLAYMYVFVFQENVNASQVTRVAIVKCLVIGVAMESVVRIGAVVSMPTPKGAIQSVESASASPDGKVNSTSNKSRLLIGCI